MTNLPEEIQDERKTIHTPQWLSARLRYDPETGKLFWKERPITDFTDAKRQASWNKQFAGKETMTTVRHTGHLCGSIDGIMYRAHRIAWAVHTGEWPKQEIDHINGVPGDNRFVNMRDVSATVNQRNKSTPRNNTSGRMGVCWDKGAWRAGIIVDGEHIYLGRFKNFDDAVEARAKAEVERDFHRNHGRLGIRA